MDRKKAHYVRNNIPSKTYPERENGGKGEQQQNNSGKLLRIEGRELPYWESPPCICMRDEKIHTKEISQHKDQREDRKISQWERGKKNMKIRNKSVIELPNNITGRWKIMEQCLQILRGNYF